jgi:hypothetical protein
MRSGFSVALALIAGFMAVEVVVGILAHSLALLSDAAHMLTDAGALVMSLVVIRLMSRPAGANLTFTRSTTHQTSTSSRSARRSPRLPSATSAALCKRWPARSRTAPATSFSMCVTRLPLPATTIYAVHRTADRPRSVR